MSKTVPSRTTAAAGDLSQITLKNFPRNGLKYSGKTGSSHETLYKKNLKKLLKPKISNEEFEELITLELSGIEDLTENLNSTNSPTNPLTPELRPSKQSNLANDFINTNIDLLKSIVPQPTNRGIPPKFSKKIIRLLMAVDDAKNPEKLAEAISDANNEDPRTLRLLNGFCEKNSLDINAPKIPFVFFKNALQAELLLIAKQVTVLEGTVKKTSVSAKSDLNQRNVVFLDRNDEDNQKSTNSSKEKMLRVIAEKRTKVVEPVFKLKLEHPIKAAVAQFDKVSDAGMSIALKNPATRPFKSALNPNLEINDTLSEEQFDALTAIEDAIIKGHGKANIRIRTGGGKTHVMKLTPSIFGIAEFEQNSDNRLPQLPLTPRTPSRKTTAQPFLSPIPTKRGNSQEPPKKQIINLDLNSSPEDLDFITTTPLEGKIVQVDEAFFWGHLFLDGRLELGTTNNSSSNNPDPIQIEKLRNDFLYDLRKRGAVTIIVGASESITKIQQECSRIESKILEEERTLSLAQNKALIKQANSFLYSINNGIREVTPVFSEILPPHKAARDYWLQQAAKPAATENDLSIPLIRNKTKSDKTDKTKIGISNKEFLIRTAWHIKELCSFTDLDEDQPAVEALYTALTPKVIGHANSKSPAQWNKANGLDELLQTAGIFPNLRFKSFTLELASLYTAVDDFLNTEYYRTKLPSDPEQKSLSINTRIDKLKDKLATRKSQLEDLTYRRDELTEQRLRDSKLFISLTPNQNQSTSLSKVVTGFLPELKEGERMQYILPDFVINEQTYNKKDLQNILNVSHADLIILPYKMESGKLKCTLVSSDNNGLLVCPDYDISDINDLLKSADSEKLMVLSFFDQTNAIGGDYGSASVNIAKQYIQLTKDNCLSGYTALNRNYFMQYDRNRTDPDEISSIDLKLILPRAALSALGNNFRLPINNRMPEELVALVDQNTKANDEFHLSGYLASKEERKGVVKTVAIADAPTITELPENILEEEDNNPPAVDPILFIEEEDIDENNFDDIDFESDEEEEQNITFAPNSTTAIIAENNSIRQDTVQEQYQEEVVPIAAIQTLLKATNNQLSHSNIEVEEDDVLSITVLEESDDDKEEEVLTTQLTTNNQLNNIEEFQEVPTPIKPSSSTKSFNIQQLVTYYQPSFTNDKIFSKNNGFMVLKEAYENDKDLTYNSHVDITNTITRIIVQSALTCAEPLNITEVVRALEISRKCGSLSLAFNNDNKELSETDYTNKEKYQKFSAHFQKTCAQCGIYSQDSRAHNPHDLNGMRTSNIPKGAVEAIGNLHNKLTSKLTSKKELENGLRKYEPDNRAALELKKEKVTEILEKERKQQAEVNGGNLNLR